MRVVILTGTGRAFCAGLDLTEATRPGGEGIASGASVAVNLDLKTTPPTVLFNMDKPTICALNGSAAGYGMDTALGCDIRHHGRERQDGGGLHQARHRAGIRRHLVPAAADRLVEGGRADLHRPHADAAEQCAGAGPGVGSGRRRRAAARARAIAAEIAANAPLAVQASKRMMRMGLSETFNDHVHHVFLQLLPLFRTQDAAEGMRAFMEKRPAVFTGR